MTLRELHAAWLAMQRPDYRVAPSVVMRPWGWSLRFDLRCYYPKSWVAFQLPEDDPSLAFARTSWDDMEARGGVGVRPFGEIWSRRQEIYLPVCGATYKEALAELARVLEVKQ